LWARALGGVGLSALLSLGLVAACDDDSPCDGGTHSDGGTKADMAGSPVAGAKVADTWRCHACHDPNDPMAGALSGRTVAFPMTMVYPANITPDKGTGIGDWSDDNMSRAIRTGVDDQGKPLCPTMPKFDMISDADMKDLIAYLRSLPAVSRTIPDSVCPPTKM
jgi:mono/diheme cytochrome c family protein